MDKIIKCSNCGEKIPLNAKFCTNCGSKNVNNKIVQENNNTITSQESKEIVKDAWHMYRRSRLKYVFFGAFVSAICLFIMGKIFGGIALVICGLLLMPPVLKRYTGVKKVIIIISAIALLFLGIVDAMEPSYGEQVIEYVKQYHAPGAYYSIGKCMEIIEEDVTELEWEYEEKNEIEYVIASFDDPLAGFIEIIIKIDEKPNDYPVLYDVKLNGRSNSQLFNDFNDILFGN